MREGQEEATEDDEPSVGSGKHALGDASCSGLQHYAVKCGADEPDLRSCHLTGNEEERRYMAGTYRRICMPGVPVV